MEVYPTDQSMGGPIGLSCDYGRLQSCGTGNSSFDSTGDNVFGLYVGGLQLKAGWSLLIMSLSQTFKRSLGFKVLGGASSYSLNSSIYFKSIFGKGDWFNVFGIRSLPTLFGTAMTWSTFRRYSLILGSTLMIDGGRRIYNFFDKKYNYD